MLTIDSILERRVVDVPPDYPLDLACSLMRERGVRHLPVLDRGRLVGVVSERDLLERGRCRGVAHPATNGRAPAVCECMSRSLDTVAPDETVERACRRMLDRRISSLPVLQGGHLIGMLTESDLLRFYERVCRFGRHAPALDPPVESIAAGEVVVVAPGTTASVAMELMRSKGIRHLPVVREGWLVGMLSDRDLLPVAGRAAERDVPVEELMARDFVAVVPGTPLSEVTECMLANGFHSLPVVARGQLKGIVTSADVLATLCTIDGTTLESAWSGDMASRAEAEG